MSTLEEPRVGHPLEPLSAEEVSAASAILKAGKGLGATARFVFVTLHEPPKAAVQAGESVPREAFIVLYERSERATYEAVVSLTDRNVVSFKHVEGVQPQITMEEFMACEEAVQANPEWQAAVRKRGIEDFSLTMLDPWAAGYTDELDAATERRILRPLTWVRSGPGDNGYARPVEGLIVEFDIDRMEVVGVEDHGVVPLPPKAGNYDPQGMAAPDNVPRYETQRGDLKPIEITQPEGPSFEVDGHHVRWQKWQLRIGFTPREGLVLHEIGYEDRGTLRPIVYRASLSEMYIPYGDPAPTHRRKNVFDMGEYGVGWLCNPLELGCDCLGEIRYFDGVCNDQDGEPLVIPNAICMHEEDVGIGWKHMDFRTEDVEVRRSRRLVISTIATVGNYEYGYFWYLYTDGTIEYEVKLTGVVSTGALPLGERPAHGTLLAPGLYAPHHQHFFAVRLDMAVDGNENTVVQVDSVPSPAGPDNPMDSAWTAQRTVYATEREAQAQIDPLHGRFWRIENAGKVSELGDPVAYKLMPGENVAPMFAPNSRFAARGGFTRNHVWVTPYDPEQRYAAGDYPYQHAGGDGLPRWTEEDRAIEDTDIVLWYVFGAHHIARPEDWPVMPVSTAGFMLKPTGFFDGNPALDMPAPSHCHHD
jgi:primary-amine oxidase